MRIGLVISNLRVGGSELYAVDLAKQLAKRHLVRIYVLGQVSESLADRCGNNIAILSGSDLLPGYLRWMYQFMLRVNAASFLFFLPYYRIEDDDLDVAHCFDSESCVVALQSSRRMKVTTGLYHRREFVWNSQSKYKRDVSRMLSAIPLVNCYVDSVEKLEHVRPAFEGEASAQSVFPFAAPEIPSLDQWASTDCENRILVPGRLRDFKSYMKTCIDMAGELQSCGYELWIVGSGPLEKELKHRACEAPNVRFIAEMELHRLARLMQTSKLVVATGTTAIVSAMIGVPTVVGVESDPKIKDGGSTHGFFFEVQPLRYYYDSKIKSRTLKQYIQHYIYLSDKEKQDIGSRHIVSASSFDIKNHANKFEIFLSAAESKNPTEYRLPLKSILAAIIKDILRIDDSVRRRYDC